MQNGSPDDSSYLVFPGHARQREVFLEGRLAASLASHRQGLPIAAMPDREPNPYDADTILGGAWARGWDDWIENGRAVDDFPGYDRPETVDSNGRRRTILPSGRLGRYLS